MSLEHFPGPAGSRGTLRGSSFLRGPPLHAAALPCPTGTRGDFWGCPVEGQELDLKILGDPFQLLIFFVSIFFFKGREGWQRRKDVGSNYGEPETQGREEQPTEQRQWPRRRLKSTEILFLCPSARDIPNSSSCAQVSQKTFLSCFYLNIFPCSGVLGGVPGCLEVSNAQLGTAREPRHCWQ